MSKRLQVLLPDADYRELQRVARAERMTVSEWIRQAIRLVQQRESRSDPRKKLEVVRTAAVNAFPTADIDQMLSEIELGYTRRPGH